MKRSTPSMRGTGEEPVLKPSRWTPARKAALVLAWLRGWNAVEMARQYGVTQAQLCSWRDQFLAGGQAALKARRLERERPCEHRIRKLESKVRRLTLENGMLRTTNLAPTVRSGAGTRSDRASEVRSPQLKAPSEYQ